MAATLPVVSLEDGLAWAAAGEAAAADDVRVAITFDDGTADFADQAVPVLDRYRVPATLYVATAFLEEQRPFPNDGVPLSWAALRESLATGVVTVGSHTHSHALLDRLPDADLAGELDRSIDLIGERVGVAAVHFAYPKAVMGSAGGRPGRAGAVRVRGPRRRAGEPARSDRRPPPGPDPRAGQRRRDAGSAARRAAASRWRRRSARSSTAAATRTPPPDPLLHVLAPFGGVRCGETAPKAASRG